jgi:hypothetical protein
MTEIIARPATGARQAPARKKATPVAAPTQQPMSEAETLCRNAAIVVCHLVEMAGGAKTISAHWCIKSLQEAALLFRHVYDVDFEPGVEEMPPDIVGQLRLGYTLLDSAIAEARERNPAAVGFTVHCMLATGYAMTLTKSLEEAYTSEDLPLLRTLATIQGAMNVAGNFNNSTRSTPASTTSQSQPRAGMCNEQLHCVLERVASNASTLNQMLMAAQATSDEAPLAVLIDGAQALAEKIGGMADDAIDGNVMGGYDHWFYGPNFGRRGGAA